MMRTLGRVGLSLGLLLLLFTAPLSYFTVTSLAPFIVSLVLGIVFVVFWGLNSGGGAGATWIRSAFFYSSSTGLGVAVLGALIALNFIAAKRAPSWDLTKEQIYSLRPQTRAVLKDLKNPVHVIAFVKDDPPEPVEELFKKYAAESERFTWEFKDPRRNPDLVKQYSIREGQPAAVIVGGGDKPVHGILNLNRLMNGLIAEQEVTNGILKLETVGTQKVYFVVGHNEIPLEPAAQTEEGIAMSLAGLKRVLQDEGYAPTPLNLVQAAQVPADASAVIIAGARNSFSELERTLLANYAIEGGRLLIFHEYGANTGLTELLAKWGMQLEPGMVADTRVNPEQPYLVYTPFLGDHPIVEPLNRVQANVFFPTSVAITKLAVEGITVTPLVLTTPYAWAELTLGEKPTQGDGERGGQLMLAAVAIHPTDPKLPTGRSHEGRVVLFGDSDLLAGAIAEAGNRDLVLNAIAWSTEQLKKVNIRPPDRDLSSVDLDNARLSTIRLVAMVLLPTLLLSVGLTIWNLRRAR